MSELEQEFKEVAAKINAKLAEATSALAEANRLSEEANLPGLIYSQFIAEEEGYARSDETDEQADQRIEDLREKLSLLNTRSLETELSKAGWSTSSSYC